MKALDILVARFILSRSTRIVRTASFVSLLILAACSGAQMTTTPPGSGSTPWTLTWSDEFDGASGSLPDATKWVMETGGNGWGNNELEYYTARNQNAQIQDGNLAITAISEDYTGSDGVTRHYTSAR